MDQREMDAVRLMAYSLLGAGKFADACTILKGIIAVDPDDTFSRRNLMQTYIRLGEYSLAEPLARSLADTATGEAKSPALFFLAHALWGEGKSDECREVVDRYADALEAEAASDFSIQ